MYIPCLFVKLLGTFFDFGIFTSSSLLTLKLTVASLCYVICSAILTSLLTLWLI